MKNDLDMIHDSIIDICEMKEKYIKDYFLFSLSEKYYFSRYYLETLPKKLRFKINKREFFDSIEINEIKDYIAQRSKIDTPMKQDIEIVAFLNRSIMDEKFAEEIVFRLTIIQTLYKVALRSRKGYDMSAPSKFLFDFDMGASLFFSDNI
jgi:hypothetical protein